MNVYGDNPGDDEQIRTRKFRNIATISLVVQVTTQGIIVNSELTSKVDGQNSSVMNICQTLRIDEILQDYEWSYCRR